MNKTFEYENVMFQFTEPFMVKYGVSHTSTSLLPKDAFVVFLLYGPKKVPGSVLRLKDDNLDADGRQLWRYATSAKCYCIDTIDAHGEPKLVKWSEHGLGHLLNPTPTVRTATGCDRSGTASSASRCGGRVRNHPGSTVQRCCG